MFSNSCCLYTKERNWKLEFELRKSKHKGLSTVVVRNRNKGVKRKLPGEMKIILKASQLEKKTVQRKFNYEIYIRNLRSGSNSAALKIDVVIDKT